MVTPNSTAIIHVLPSYTVSAGVLIHRRYQRQRRLPTATALAFDSGLAAASWVMVFGVYELVAQCAAALPRVELVVQDDEA